MPNKIEFSDLLISVQMPTLPTMVVPFSSGSDSTSITYSPTHNGSDTALMCTFGYAISESLGYGFDALTGKSTSFINSSNSNKVCAFAVATDMSQINISAEVFITSAINNSYSISPYVALAVVDSNSDIFQIIPETVTTITTFNANQSYSSNTVYTISKENISVTISKGSRVAIICGFTCTGTSSSYNLTNLCFAGGIAFW